MVSQSYATDISLHLTVCGNVDFALKESQDKHFGEKDPVHMKVLASQY